MPSVLPTFYVSKMPQMIIFGDRGMDRDGMGPKSITHPITSRRNPIPTPPITRDGMGRDS